MKVEYNYTGRKKIHLNEIALSFIQQKEGGYDINVNFDLSRLDLEASCKIYLEVSYVGFFQSIDLGTFDQPIHPYNGVLNKELNGWIESLRCVLKVVDEEGSIGMIKALSPKIRGSVINIDEGTGGKKSFLPVIQRDLGEVPWKLQIEQYSVTLIVNKKIEDVKNILLNDPVKRSLIFPLIMREIVTKIVSARDYSIEGDDWYIVWNKYISRHLKIDFPEESNASDERNEKFINETVDKFCRLQKSASQLKSN